MPRAPLSDWCPFGECNRLPSPTIGPSHQDRLAFQPGYAHPLCGIQKNSSAGFDDLSRRQDRSGTPPPPPPVRTFPGPGCRPAAAVTDGRQRKAGPLLGPAFHVVREEPHVPGRHTLKHKKAERTAYRGAAEVVDARTLRAHLLTLDALAAGKSAEGRYLLSAATVNDDVVPASLVEPGCERCGSRVARRAAGLIPLLVGYPQGEPTAWVVRNDAGSLRRPLPRHSDPDTPQPSMPMGIPPPPARRTGTVTPGNEPLSTRQGRT
jgi:hypothetical protein